MSSSLDDTRYRFHTTSMQRQIPIFIRNISRNDELFIEAANKYGHPVIGNIIDNDDQEIEEFKRKYLSIKLITTTTAFQKKISFWLSVLINQIQIEIFRIQHLPNFEFRNPRYTKINILAVFLGVLIPALRPYLRFQNKNWDKDLYLQELRLAGLPVPEIYATLRDNQEANQKLLNSVEFPCVCKPSSCSGGNGVFLAKDYSDIERLYSYDQNYHSQSSLSIYYRNKTSRGIRNYIYNSHTLGGRYVFQKYIKGRVFSLSATLINKQLISVFCYEIQSANSQYFAEQGFSWPVDKKIECEIIPLATKMAEVLKFPEGPLMADFIHDDNGQLSIIDASPRASSTAAKLSQLVHEDNWHAECLLLATIDKKLQSTPSRKCRPVFWQRLPLPKGLYESIHYPDLVSNDIIDYKLTVTVGTQINEARTDRQMIERGEFATTGNSVEEAKSKWDSYFKKIEWKLKD